MNAIAITHRAARLAAAALLLTVAVPAAARAQSPGRWLKSRLAHAAHDSSSDTTHAASTTSTSSAAALAKRVAGDTPLGMEAKLAKFYGSAIRTQFAHQKRYGGTALEPLDPTTAAAAEKALLAQGFTLQSVSLQHLDPDAMLAIAPILEGAASGARGRTPNRAAASPTTTSSGGDADTQMLAMGAELQEMQMHAAAGDTVAARRLVRYQEEMNGAALRLHSSGTSSDATGEMRRALDCAKTGRGCRAKSH